MYSKDSGQTLLRYHFKDRKFLVFDYETENLNLCCMNKPWELGYIVIENGEIKKSVNDRILWIDVARGISILAMITFHFAFDLMYFGLAKSDLIYQPDWRLFERIIASSFLYIAGLSLFITHSSTINWKSFIRRYGATTVCAVLISLVTFIWHSARYFSFRIDRFIFTKTKNSVTDFVIYLNFCIQSFSTKTYRRSLSFAVVNIYHWNTKLIRLPANYALDRTLYFRDGIL